MAHSSQHPSQNASLQDVLTEIEASLNESGVLEPGSGYVIQEVNIKVAPAGLNSNANTAPVAGSNNGGLNGHMAPDAEIEIVHNTGEDDGNDESDED